MSNRLLYQIFQWISRLLLPFASLRFHLLKVGNFTIHEIWKILEFTEIAASLWPIIGFPSHFLSEARENHIVYAEIWKVCKVTQLFFTVRESRKALKKESGLKSLLFLFIFDLPDFGISNTAYSLVVL